ETARVLAERERVIDALFLEVEHLASREVLLQAPVAADLRFLLLVLRVTPELERSHDLVMQVTDRAGLAAPGGGPAPARSPRGWQTLSAGCGAKRPNPGPARPHRGGRLVRVRPGDGRAARRPGRRARRPGR
ncbi:MAG: PhoU domain-containing protein, partial [Trebonia sp.]